MSKDSSMPCSSSEVDKYQLLKRKAHESIQHLLSEHRSPEKRRKPDTDKFLNEYKDNLRTFQYTLWATSEFNPRELAQHGWRPVFRDPVARKSVIECIHCEKKMSTEVGDSTGRDDEAHQEIIKKIRQDLSNSHRLTCIYRSSKVDFKYLYRYSQDFINDVIELAPSYKMELCLENDCIASLGTLHYENYSRNCLILAGLHWKMQITEWGSTVCGDDNKFDAVKSHRWFCPLLDKISQHDHIWQRRLKHITTDIPQKTTEGLPSSGAVLALRVAKLLRSSISCVVKT